MASSAVLVAACGGDDTSPATTAAPAVTPPIVAVEPTEPPSTPTPDSAEPTTAEPTDGAPTPAEAPTDTPEPTLQPVAVPAGLDVELTTLIGDFPRPIAMRPRPGSDQLVLASKLGRIVTLEIEGDTAVITEELIDIGSRLSEGQEQGLLGIAIAPDGGHLYADYTDRAGTTTIVEWALTADGLDLDSERTVLTVAQPASNHNAGDIVFGPDGFLYITLGDGGGGGDPYGTGQDPGSLLGSILRISPRAGEPYAVPSDNPFVSGGGAAEVWLYGVRNPWRIAFDRLTGDLWVADVGQDRLEEISVAYASASTGRGANLGWSAVEGTAPYLAAAEPADDYLGPIHEYTHDDGCSITGGYVYRGQAIPELNGIYLYGDFCSGQVWGLASTEADGVLGNVPLISVDAGAVGSFGQDAEGELYLLDYQNARLQRFDPAT